MTPKLHNFIKTGTKPLTTRERAALLDEARSVLTAEVTNWTPPSTAEQLDRIERDSKANKSTLEKAHELLAAKVKEQRSKLQARGIGRPAAKPAPAKPQTPDEPINFATADPRKIISQASNVRRGAKILAQVRAQFASMKAGPERTAFYRNYRHIL